MTEQFKDLIGQFLPALRAFPHQYHQGELIAAKTCWQKNLFGPFFATDSVIRRAYGQLRLNHCSTRKQAKKFRLAACNM